MSYVHLIFGIALLVLFPITGRLMRLDFPDKDAIPPEFRILMRSRHIYLLFASLIHILLGLYLVPYQDRVRKSVQVFGSFLLILGATLLVWAFFYETYFIRHFSDVSRWGIYLSLAGTAFHLLAKIPARRA